MNFKLEFPLLCAAAFAAFACGSPAVTRSGLNPADFRAVADGKSTDLYTLVNGNGAEVCITNFGGRVVSLMVPDRDGRLRDVVLGFDCIGDYMEIPSDFGAAVGRYANRIDRGRFTLDGVEYDLPKNNFGHCLHGGPRGWQYRVYEVESVASDSIVLRMDSADGDENFPGAVTARVTYRLTADNALDVSFEAVTDAPTVVNMINHSYFNLSGDPSRSVCDDVLTVWASEYTPVDSTFMTTGEIAPVEGTPMDFRTPRRIGERIGDLSFEQIRNGNGYDHNWVLDTAGDISRKAVELRCEESGIVLSVYTDQPGMQIYSGNFLDGSFAGKRGTVYGQRSGICFEAQHYPDSPNKPQWPSTVLRPGETYRNRCIYAFSTDEE